MRIEYRPIKVWPEGWQARTGRPYGPFKATWTKTLALLDRELWQIEATACTMQVACTERDCRLDGSLRADARLSHPGVILTVETRKHGSLIYSTDRFQAWQDNVRAIALGMEALRKVERYGIADRGQQYAGYREIGTGIALGPAQMTVEQAARILKDVSDAWDLELDEIIGNDEIIGDLYRRAAKDHHPDAGGDAATFRTITTARDVLTRA